MTINRDGGGVFVIVHGGTRRVGTSNEAVTGRRDGKIDGVDEGKERGSAAAAAAALCVAIIKARYEKKYI